jgi:hypothetical protein
MERVWYGAYGSNLALGRFRCYLAGGRPTGGRRVYPGCRDRRDPERVVGVHVPGALVFAGESAVWGGGSAFYDATTPGRVACRAYLLTPGQLGDVAAQEMRREPGGEFAREVAGLLADLDSMHSMGPGRYETVVRLGDQDGVPMFTMTHGHADALEPTAPTAGYLRWLAAGLNEAHGWNGARIAEYLIAARGVNGAWTPAGLAALVNWE